MVKSATRNVFWMKCMTNVFNIVINNYVVIEPVSVLVNCKYSHHVQFILWWLSSWSSPWRTSPEVCWNHFGVSEQFTEQWIRLEQDWYMQFVGVVFYSSQLLIRVHSIGVRKNLGLKTMAIENRIVGLHRRRWVEGLSVLLPTVVHFGMNSFLWGSSRMPLWDKEVSGSIHFTTE